jgi:tight adherence protein B
MTFLLGFIFAAVLVLSFTTVALATRPTKHQKAVHKRLGLIAQDHPAQADAGHESQQLLKETANGGFTPLDRLLARFASYASLQLLIEQANSKTSAGNILFLSLGLAAGGFILPYLFLPILLLQAGLAVAGAVAPVITLRIRRTRRLKAFNEALPGSMDLMSRALRAGHSVASAIEVVGQEGQGPVASEFGLVYQQQNFGLPFRDALMQMSRRVPSPDLQFVITAMLVQKDTGGNLTEILDRTVHVIRERLRIHGEVRVKTAQGRLTGWILTSLPVILGVMLSIMNPTYAEPLFHDPMGVKMLYAGAGMLVIGGLVIRKIVAIEV